MATADISKEAVFDARIVQLPARYAVGKGALSLTNSPYNAIAANGSQHTYNINVPSQNVFVDRNLLWSSQVKLQMLVSTPAVAVVGFQPILAFGRDAALAPYPLTSLVNTTTATINDTSVTINTQTVFREVLRLVDYRKNRLPATAPVALDTIAQYGDGTGSNVTPLADYLVRDGRAPDQEPNGSWGSIIFIDPTTGSEFPASPVSTTYANTGGSAGVPLVTVANGIPVRVAGDGAGVVSYFIAIQFTSTEPVVLSPFIFADAAEWETGLFGINNIQIVYNMNSDLSRIIRNNAAAAGRAISSVAYCTAGNSTGYANAKINVQYLTPSLDLPLPAKSVVQYLEYPRYLSPIAQVLPARQTTSGISSNPIVLPQIPDALIIYCKPGSNVYTPAAGDTFGDWYLPITQISLNFDNFAGLLSSHSQEQLYQMAVHNGLNMSFTQWRGQAMSAALGATSFATAADVQNKVQTSGGFLVFKMGQDITLQAGQAPGLIGNFTLQFTCSVFNPSAVPVLAGDATLFVIAVNSGFFESLAGSSRIVKGVLSEADIISAPPSAELTHDGLARMVGHGFMDKMGSFLSKARDIYTATKPAISGLKGLLPDTGALGKVKSAASAVGYGRSGGAMGCGMPAGGKSLSARLM